MNIKDHISKKYLKNNLIHLPSNIKKIKIDVGLSVNAPVSFQWLEDDPNVVVFGFEPNLKNVEAIKSGSKKPVDFLEKFENNNIKKYLGKRFFIFPYALSQENGEKTFYNVLNKSNKNNSGYEFESGQSSLLKPINMEYTTSKVKIFNLFSFLSNFDWNQIKVISQLKIDAQGEDFKIIYGLKKYIRKINIISYEINAPGYYGYKNYRFQNIKMFLYMFINGFYPSGKSSSEFIFKNLRYKSKKDKYFTIGS